MADMLTRNANSSLWQLGAVSIWYLMMEITHKLLCWTDPIKVYMSRLGYGQLKKILQPGRYVLCSHRIHLTRQIISVIIYCTLIGLILNLRTDSSVECFMCFASEKALSVSL